MLFLHGWYASSAYRSWFVLSLFPFRSHLPSFRLRSRCVLALFFCRSESLADCPFKLRSVTTVAFFILHLGFYQERAKIVAGRRILSLTFPTFCGIILGYNGERDKNMRPGFLLHIVLRSYGAGPCRDAARGPAHHWRLQ